jgi:hypothetical protein
VAVSRTNFAFAPAVNSRVVSEQTPYATPLLYIGSRMVHNATLEPSTTFQMKERHYLIAVARAP